MYAHDYGLKNFTYKTNFNGLVVLPDVLQEKIKDKKPVS